MPGELDFAAASEVANSAPPRAAFAKLAERFSALIKVGEAKSPIETDIYMLQD